LSAVIAAIHATGLCDGTGGISAASAGPSRCKLLMAPSGVDKGSIESRRPDPGECGGQQVIAGHGAGQRRNPAAPWKSSGATGARAYCITHPRPPPCFSRRGPAQRVAADRFSANKRAWKCSRAWRAQFSHNSLDCYSRAGHVSGSASPSAWRLTTLGEAPHGLLIAAKRALCLGTGSLLRRPPI